MLDKMNVDAIKDFIQIVGFYETKHVCCCCDFQGVVQPSEDNKNLNALDPDLTSDQAIEEELGYCSNVFFSTKKL